MAKVTPVVSGVGFEALSAPVGGEEAAVLTGIALAVVARPRPTPNSCGAKPKVPPNPPGVEGS